MGVTLFLVIAAESVDICFVGFVYMVVCLDLPSGTLRNLEVTGWVWKEENSCPKASKSYSTKSPKCLLESVRGYSIDLCFTENIAKLGLCPHL